MILSTKLSSNTAQRDLAVRAKAGLLQIVKSLQRISNTNPAVFFKLFDSRIQPILLYASEIWGFEDCQAVENVHITAMKRFCNVPTKTPNAMLYGDCGRYPMYINATIRGIKYWCKLLKMDQMRYPAKVYRMMLNDIEKGYNWSCKVRKVLMENNFGDFWNDQKVENEAGFVRELRKRLLHNFEEKWRAQLNHSSRYFLYSEMKRGIELENYLKYDGKRVFRDTFVRFRMQMSDIYAHRYRYDSSKSLTCPSCREDDEDDKHFLLECPVYEDLRQRLLRKYMAVGVNNYAFLIGSRDFEVLHNVSLYMYHAFRRRIEGVELMSVDANLF